MLPETVSDQRQIIDRGIELDFPLGKIVKVLGLPVKFSVDMRWSFSKVDLADGELTQLVPDAVVGDSYDYDQALVIKLGNRPMLAICTGLDKSVYLDNNRPIAAVFNLLHPDEQEMVAVGGLDVSGLLAESLDEEVLQITATDRGVSLSLVLLKACS